MKSKEDFWQKQPTHVELVLTFSWIKTETANKMPHLAGIAQVLQCHAHDTTAAVRGVREQSMLLDWHPDQGYSTNGEGGWAYLQPTR